MYIVKYMNLKSSKSIKSSIVQYRACLFIYRDKTFVLILSESRSPYIGMPSDIGLRHWNLFRSSDPDIGTCSATFGQDGIT